MRATMASTSIRSTGIVLACSAAMVCSARAQATTKNLSTLVRCELSAAQTGSHDRFVVTTLGTVLVRPDKLLTEGDEATVTVLVNPALKSLLRIRRTTAFREPGAINILGAGLSVTADASIRGMADTGIPACEELTASVADLA